MKALEQRSALTKLIGDCARERREPTIDDVREAMGDARVSWLTVLTASWCGVSLPLFVEAMDRGKAR